MRSRQRGFGVAAKLNVSAWSIFDRHTRQDFPVRYVQKGADAPMLGPTSMDGGLKKPSGAKSPGAGAIICPLSQNTVRCQLPIKVLEEQPHV